MTVIRILLYNHRTKKLQMTKDANYFLWGILSYCVARYKLCMDVEKYNLCQTNTKIAPRKCSKLTEIIDPCHVIFRINLIRMIKVISHLYNLAIFIFFSNRDKNFPHSESQFRNKIGKIYHKARRFLIWVGIPIPMALEHVKWLRVFSRRGMLGLKFTIE